MPTRLYEGVDLNRIEDRDVRAALKILDDHARSVGPAVDAVAASAGSGSGSGAPTTASYVTVSNEASLTGERALAVDAPVTKSDGGANGALTLGVTLVAPAFTFGTTAAAGVANSLVRSDAGIALFDATVPADLANAAATGGVGTGARRDHAHRSYAVRKNSTGSDFVRKRLNLIEGANVTLTVADDAGSDEVDVTIASAGGGGGATNFLGISKWGLD